MRKRTILSPGGAVATKNIADSFMGYASRSVGQTDIPSKPRLLYSTVPHRLLHGLDWRRRRCPSFASIEDTFNRLSYFSLSGFLSGPLANETSFFF